MRLRMIVVICVLFYIFINTVNAEQDAQDDLIPNVRAESWILKNISTGEVVASSNERKPGYPASITKIVTAIVAIESGNPDDIVTISETAASTEGSRLFLKKGDKIPLRQLLNGMMLRSGNDASVAVAEHISGSESEFAKRMNAFVSSIGASHTHFKNASGLPDPLHWTTAYDMALITEYAMKNDDFRAIVSQPSYPWIKELWRDGLAKSERYLSEQFQQPWTGEPILFNHNRLLFEYDGATGIKNGYTSQAKTTLVGSAKRSETELLAVLLKVDSQEALYEDMKALLDYGFAAVEAEAIAKVEEERKAAEEAAERARIEVADAGDAGSEQAFEEAADPSLQAAENRTGLEIPGVSWLFAFILLAALLIVRRAMKIQHSRNTKKQKGTML